MIDQVYLGKNVHQQVEIYNKTLLKNFHNYIPNKFILCDDPTWINEEIKTLIHRKNSLYQSQRKVGSINYTSLKALTLDVSNAISTSKLKYHERLANKLNDPKTAPKTYWAIMETFVNSSKIPMVPPLPVDNKLVTDFWDKANLFNNFFTEQCSPISNGSTVLVSISFVTRKDFHPWNFVLLILLRLLDH